MSIGEIIAWIVGVAGVLGTFIEVSKIKFNPWSSLFKWIGKKMNAEVMEEIKGLKEADKKLLEEQHEIKKEQQGLRESNQ